MEPCTRAQGLATLRQDVRAVSGCIYKVNGTRVSQELISKCLFPSRSPREHHGYGSTEPREASRSGQGRNTLPPLHTSGILSTGKFVSTRIGNFSNANYFFLGGGFPKTRKKNVSYLTLLGRKSQTFLQGPARPKAQTPPTVFGKPPCPLTTGASSASDGFPDCCVTSSYLG